MGGGGHFLSKNRIALNHRADEMDLRGESVLPRIVKIEPFGGKPGWGEDDPVWSERLLRDGWRLVSYPARDPFAIRGDLGAKVWVEFSPPITWRKPNPIYAQRYSLEMSILGLKEVDGPWYLTEHTVIRDTNKPDKIGRTDWADWSHTGDLLFAMDGCLYRVPCKGGTLHDLASAVKVTDLSRLRFEPRESPEEAKRWPNS